MTVSLGHPKPAATAHLSPQAVAYNPQNGDEAVAVVAGTAAHVYLIAGANEPNEYHIQTAKTTFGTLVKGDAYLVAGSGTLGQVADPGAPTTITGGSPTPLAVENPVAPISLGFDHSGNLLVNGYVTVSHVFTSGIQMVAKASCSSSCPYLRTTLSAGNLYTLAGEGMRGITRVPHVAFTFGVAGWGLSVDAQGNFVDSANGMVLYVNVSTSPVTRYGKTIAARTSMVVAGTVTTGPVSTNCGGGSVTRPATGTQAPNLTFTHPYVDGSGNLFLNDNSKNTGAGCVWVVPAASGSLDGLEVTAGDMYPLSGSASTPAFANGGTANTSAFANTSAVVTDPAGNLVVSLSGTHPAVRVIAESNGTYYGQAMTKGHAYLISGGPTATRTTTPGDATGFKFAGVPVTLTPPAFGITSLVNGAAGDVLLANGATATTSSVYQITGGPTTAPPAPPTVTAVSPEKGPEAGGTTVTVTGTNFTATAKVKFGTNLGTTVHVTSSTKLTVKDPGGTGTVAVVVTDTNGTGQLTTAFTYVPAPTVTKVSPTSGPAGGGTTVTVTGTNFTTVTAVDFGTTPGTAVHVTSPTTLTVKDPGGTGTVAVKVTAAGGTGRKTAAFTYIASPTVTKVSPDVGPLAGGTTVTVTGTNFTATATVTFGTTAGTTVTVKSATKLTVLSPAGTGTVAVKVTTSVGTGQKATAFTYVGGPTITTVNPDKGPEAGGTTVTVTGTNFTATATVTFGTTPGTSVTVKSSTKLTVKDPEGSGTVAVSVTAAGGSGTATTAFTYVPAPTVTKVSPTSGPAGGGTTVTVTGTNFTTVTAVDFGTTPGTAVHVTSPTTLTVKNPGGTGTVAVKVTAAGGTGKKTAAFTYIPSPTVTKVSPDKGPLGGGTAVTVTGTNFTATATVTFGTTPGTTVTVKSATKLTVLSPAGTGTVAVKVTTSVGTGEKATAFTYVGPPTVTKVSPDKGPLGGGTTVTVTGTNFTTVTSVDFATTPGTSVTVKSSTQLTVHSPAGSGTVAVSVTAVGGSGKKTTAFTYVPAPTVTKVTPTSGPAGGGTTVTVTGSNFTTVTAVDFGATAGTAVTVKSPTQLTVKDPAGSGKVAVSVIGAGGTGKLTTAFTYIPSPTVTHVSPDKAKATSSTPVVTATITGTNFATVTAVKFGTTPGTTVHVTSPTKLTVKVPEHAAGAVTVSVTTAVGGTGSLPGGFTYVGPPTVTKLTPDMGPTSGGTTVTITGTNFTTASTVHFGFALATGVHVTSSTKLTVVDPAGTPGPVSLTVTALGGTVNVPSAFTYVAAPTVTKVSPTSGPAKGGTTVTVTGSNFTTVTAVDFGSAPGTSVSVKSSTQLTVVSPAGSGTVAVSVTTPGGTGKLTKAFSYTATPTPPPPSTKGKGYWEVASDGGLFAFGAAQFYGSMGGMPLNKPIVGMTSTPTGKGYWEVASDGGLFAFGSAQFYGSMGGQPLNQPIVGMTATPTGKGYWEVASDGGLFAFGAAQFFGSMGGMPLNKPVVGMTATPTGKGYWEVASDGGLFAFGNAQFYGSMGGQPLNQPIVGMTSTTTGKGYWEVASDGGLFSFGAAQFHGSMGGMPLNKPIVGMTATTTGNGYWEVASDGGIFAFGSAQFFGSMGGQPLNAPIVGIAVVNGT